MFKYHRILEHLMLKRPIYLFHLSKKNKIPRFQFSVNQFFLKRLIWDLVLIHEFQILPC